MLVCCSTPKPGQVNKSTTINDGTTNKITSNKVAFRFKALGGRCLWQRLPQLASKLGGPSGHATCMLRNVSDPHPEHTRCMCCKDKLGCQQSHVSSTDRQASAVAGVALPCPMDATRSCSSRNRSSNSSSNSNSACGRILVGAIIIVDIGVCFLQGVTCQRYWSFGRQGPKQWVPNGAPRWPQQGKALTSQSEVPMPAEMCGSPSHARLCSRCCFKDDGRTADMPVPCVWYVKILCALQLCQASRREAPEHCKTAHNQMVE